MEQLVLLLIIAAISLINWIIQKSAEHRKNRKQEEAAREAGEEPAFQDEFEPAFHDEERETASARESKRPDDELRKFLEAMGLPVEEEAPTPRPNITEAPAPPPLPQQPKAKKPRQSLREMRELAARFEKSEDVHSAAYSERPTVAPMALFGTMDQIRQGIVMREVLGPPRGLDPYGNTPDDVAAR